MFCLLSCESPMQLLTTFTRGRGLNFDEVDGPATSIGALGPFGTCKRAPRHAAMCLPVCAIHNSTQKHVPRPLIFRRIAQRTRARFTPQYWPLCHLGLC